MHQQVDASYEIEFPSRGMWLGRSRSGKTTSMVNFLCNKYIPEHKITRIIVVCPNFLYQETFKPLRTDTNIAKLIAPEDIYHRPIHLKKETFAKILESIEKKNLEAKSKGNPLPRNLIIVDDLAGKKIIQGRGQGPFAHLAIQTPHISTSLFVAVQQPKAADLAFRLNCEFIIAFPFEGKISIEYMQEAYCTAILSHKKMKRILGAAWCGGKNDASEYGKHFLFILQQPRVHTRFFIDFKEEILITNG